MRGRASEERACVRASLEGARFWDFLGHHGNVSNLTFNRTMHGKEEMMIAAIIRATQDSVDHSAAWTALEFDIQLSNNMLSASCCMLKAAVALIASTMMCCSLCCGALLQTPILTSLLVCSVGFLLTAA